MCIDMSGQQDPGEWSAILFLIVACLEININQSGVKAVQLVMVCVPKGWDPVVITVKCPVTAALDNLRKVALFSSLFFYVCMCSLWLYCNNKKVLLPAWQSQNEMF